MDTNGQPIYLFGGECDRTAGEITGDLHAASNGYAYEDLWSWNIKRESWRLERLNGNAPCPRSEATCTYVSFSHHGIKLSDVAALLYIDVV
jgi:lysozyme family protein